MLNWEALFGGWGEFLPKCVVAVCTAIACFRMADNRLRSLGFLVSMTLCGLFLQAALWLVATKAGDFHWEIAMGLGSSGMLGLLVAYGRQWLSRSPTDLHREETISVSDPPATQSKSAKQEARRLRRAGRNVQGPAAHWGEVTVLAVIVTAFAVASFADLDLRLQASIAGDGAGMVAGKGPDGGLGLGMLKLHWVVVSLTWGLGLFYCVQLTILSSPSDFDSEASTPVNWLRSFSLSTLLFAVSMLVCVSIFFAERRPERIETVRDHLLPMVFAFTWLLLSFVAWMIPARLYRFLQQGQAKEWVSLTLAAWIAFLCLGLVAFLPSAWPWSWM
ncbi:MAG: hypothetical protein AB8B50_07135 [Pirellulaceae bacterium]